MFAVSSNVLVQLWAWQEVAVSEIQQARANVYYEFYSRRHVWFGKFHSSERLQQGINIHTPVFVLPSIRTYVSENF